MDTGLGYIKGLYIFMVYTVAYMIQKFPFGLVLVLYVCLFQMYAEMVEWMYELIATW